MPVNKVSEQDYQLARIKNLAQLIVGLERLRHETKTSLIDRMRLFADEILMIADEGTEK